MRFMQHRAVRLWPFVVKCIAQNLPCISFGSKGSTAVVNRYVLHLIFLK